MADWKLRRGDSEWPVESIAMLQEWARSGRVVGSDYVFNPILEKWVYAEDVRELREVITKTTTGEPATRKALNKIAIGIVLIIFGIALIAISPQTHDESGKEGAIGFGIVLLIAGGVFSAVGVSGSKASN